MSLIATRGPGRQLMVLDDAETIARQRRRRAAMRRRQRERLQQLGVIAAVAGIMAIIAGQPLVLVLGVLAVLALVLGLALHRLRDLQAAERRRRVICQPGPGVGTPRPKGGFSTTRHRSGAPVWVHPDGSRAA